MGFSHGVFSHRRWSFDRDNPSLGTVNSGRDNNKKSRQQNEDGGRYDDEPITPFSYLLSTTNAVVERNDDYWKKIERFMWSDAMDAMDAMETKGRNDDANDARLAGEEEENDDDIQVVIAEDKEKEEDATAVKKKTKRRKPAQ